MDDAARHDNSLEDARRQVRVDLAAAHRLAYREELTEGIHDHFTHRVPGREDRYYQVPFGTHWSEVTASCFMEVDHSGKRAAGEGQVEPSTVALHAPLHRRLPQAACVMRSHSPFAATLARLKDGRIRAIGQTELGLVGDIVYDDALPGLTAPDNDGERLAKIMGADKHQIVTFRHGAIVVGKSVADAYRRLIYLERICQMQVQALWMGTEMREISPETIEEYNVLAPTVGQKMGGKMPLTQYLFEALKRILDRESPGYKD